MVFNQPITIQRLTEDERWEDFFSCRSYVNALYGSEYWVQSATFLLACYDDFNLLGHFLGRDKLLDLLC